MFHFRISVITMQKMGADLGQTLEQMRKSMGMSGMPASGMLGQMGKGQAGMSGSQTQFGLFGSEQFGKKSKQKQRMGMARRIAKADQIKGEPDPLAGNVEELAAPKSANEDVGPVSGEKFMEEYRRLIEAYQQRMAEEE